MHVMYRVVQKSWCQVARKFQPGYSQPRPAMPGWCLANQSLFLRTTLYYYCYSALDLMSAPCNFQEGTETVGYSKEGEDDGGDCEPDVRRRAEVHGPGALPLHVVVRVLIISQIHIQQLEILKLKLNEM